jgi:hypothetical protein
MVVQIVDVDGILSVEAKITRQFARTVTAQKPL